jgi:CheY-like chemotaxis protein
MEQRQTSAKKKPAAPGKTILLAEDDSLVRELVHEYLKDHDYQMPNMDGLTLSEQISESRPGTKTLLMSGYTGDSSRFSQGERPAPAFIQKPFMPLDLLDRIERLTA